MRFNGARLNEGKPSRCNNDGHSDDQIKDSCELYRHLSVRLYDVLDHIGASADFRKLRQDRSISQEIMMTIAFQLSKKEFTAYIFCSSSEGTTIPSLNSDTDVVLCLGTPVVENISETGDGLTYLMIRDTHTPPGYVKLQTVYYNGQPETVHIGYINPDYEEFESEGRKCYKHLSYVGGNVGMDERNGPADTNTESNIDHVLGFTCSTIPAFAREWIGRHRNKWPSQRTLNKISTMGCLVVGVGHPTSIEKNIEWRLSFSLQERELISIICVPLESTTLPLSNSSNNLPHCETCYPGQYGYTCDHTCKSQCVSCTNFNKCEECIAGRYGQACFGTCSVGCQDGVCFKSNGSCECRPGFDGTRCTSCASNSFGKFPNCIPCQDKCATCTGIESCQTCFDGYYSGHEHNTVNKVYNCSHECPVECKSCQTFDICTECKTGFYGIICNKICSHGCLNGTCAFHDGVCTCTESFIGDTCDKCVNGKYGDECNLACVSDLCSGDTCNKQTGECLACTTGHYGNNSCNGNCSVSCSDRVCDYNTGVCTFGCENGFSGDKCCTSNAHCISCSSNDVCSECEDGYSGDKCCLANDLCVTCSSNSSCSLCIPGLSGDLCCINNDKCITCGSNSTCSKCIPGLSGDKCCLDNEFCEICISDTECGKCTAGKCGDKCLADCPLNCGESSCNINGTCDVCRAGYHGTKCDCKIEYKECGLSSNCIECAEDYFRSELEINECVKCSNACKDNVCDSDTGYCLSGCNIRRWGDICEKECETGCIICDKGIGECHVCDNGKYGTNCSLNCDEICQKSDDGYRMCNIQNGTCYDGCQSDFIFGQFCEKSCSEKCVDKRCHWETGYCYECLENQYGTDCEVDCGSNCLQLNNSITTCYGINGTCMYGCIDGFFGDKCGSKCSDNCGESSCNITTGECIVGCVDGLIGSDMSCSKVGAHVGEDDVLTVSTILGGSLVGIVVTATLVAFVLVMVISKRQIQNYKCSEKESGSYTVNDPISAKDSALSGITIYLTDGDTSDGISAEEPDIMRVLPEYSDVQTYGSMDDSGTPKTD